LQVRRRARRKVIVWAAFVALGVSMPLAMAGHTGAASASVRTPGQVASQQTQADGQERSGNVFTAISPRRVMDTRVGTGVRRGPVPRGGIVTLTVPGIPPGTTAVALNVTATAPTRSGFVTVFPAGTPRPNASTLNFTAGETIANMVTVAVAADGTVSFYNFSGSTHLVADLAGYYTPDTGSAFTAVSPRRVMDTRVGTGVRRGAVAGGEIVTLQVPGLPAATSAVTLNVTAVAPTRRGFLTVFPGGARRPDTSTLNFEAGQNIPNMITVAVGAGGTVSFYNFSGSTQVLADVAGYYAPVTGAGFADTSPRRVMDTRVGIGVHGGAVPPRGTVTLAVPGLPAGTTAVTLNVTAVAPTRAGFLTVFPAATRRPNASTLNFSARQTIPNMVTVAVGTGGRVSFYNHTGSTQLVADLAGYYVRPVPFAPVPERFAFYYQTIDSAEDIEKLGDVTSVVTTSNETRDPGVIRAFDQLRAETGRDVDVYRYFQTYWYPSGRAIDGLDMAQHPGWAFCLTGSTPAVGKEVNGEKWFYLDFNEGAVRAHVLRQLQHFKELGYDGVFLDRGLAAFTDNTIGRHPGVWHRRSTCTNDPYLQDPDRSTFSDSFAAMLSLAHRAGLKLVLNYGYSPKDPMFPLRPDPRDPACRAGEFSTCRTIWDVRNAVDFYLDEAITHPRDIRWRRDFAANLANEQDPEFGGRVIGLVTDGQLDHDTSPQAVYFAYARARLFDFPVTAFTGDDNCRGITSHDLCNRVGLYPRLSSAYFGQPVMAAPQETNCVRGSRINCVWYRTYTQGASIVNATAERQVVHIDLPGTGCRRVTSLVSGQAYSPNECNDPLAVTLPAWSGVPVLYGPAA
jgi:hypothetical protein